MEIVKKYAGIVWISIACMAGYFNIAVMGIPKLQTGKQEDMVFALINLFILTPIVVGGLMVFGYYSLKNEYSHKNK